MSINRTISFLNKTGSYIYYGSASISIFRRERQILQNHLIRLQTTEVALHWETDQ